MNLVVPVRGYFGFSYRDPVSRKRDWDFYLPNAVTTEGLDYLLNAAFRGGTQQANWYLGLIDNSGYSALAAGDTHAAHAGWGEYTGIFLSSRPAWNVATAANSGQLASSTPSVFSITANGSVRGAFVASRQLVGVGAGAVLYSTAAMSSGMSVSSGGTLSVTYTARLRN
jgi:hypothetical protein